MASNSQIVLPFRYIYQVLTGLLHLVHVFVRHSSVAVHCVVTVCRVPVQLSSHKARKVFRHYGVDGGSSQF